MIATRFTKIRFVVWMNPGQQKNNGRDTIRSEVTRRLSRYLSSCARDESVNTIARLRCELWTANFVSDWIPERERAKGRIRATMRREIRERRKKGGGGFEEGLPLHRCLSTGELRDRTGRIQGPGMRWYRLITMPGAGIGARLASIRIIAPLSLRSVFLPPPTRWLLYAHVAVGVR